MPTNPVSAKNRQLGILLMCGAMVFLAVSEALIKKLTQTVPFPVAGWGRFLFHFLSTVPFFLMAGRWRLIRTRRPVLHTIRAVAIFAGTFMFFAAVTTMPLAEATSIVFAAPLFVTALSALFLGERLGPFHWMAVAAGFVGVVIIIRPGPGFADWIALLPLATALCYATFQIFTRVLSYTEHYLTVFFFTGFGTLVLMSFVVPFYWVSPTWSDWGWMAVSGLFGSVGQFLLTRAFHKAEASVISPFMYTQIIWTIGLGMLLFGNFPDLVTFIGMAIIVASGIFIWHRNRRRLAAPAPPSAAPPPG
ncbi:MAG: DMT family transporter [Alphaproteobacteria bacterium]